MAWWLGLLLWAGSFTLNRVLTPRIRAPRAEHAKALTLADFEQITATEGRAIPVVFGTRLIRGANIGWYGDFSTVAITEGGGATIGYKYYLGTQYLICMGPIDAVAELRFNERQVGVGISSTNNQIVFAASGGAPWKTAKIPLDSYEQSQLAQAIEAAMKVAEPGDWRVGYGFTIVAGVNDRIYYKLIGDFPDSGVVYMAALTPGNYTASLLAGHVGDRLRVAEAARPGGAVSTLGCSYNGGTFKFSISSVFNVGEEISAIGPSQLVLVAAGGANGKFMLGYRHDQDQTLTHPTTLLTGAYVVKEKRFIFSYGGTTAALRCTDAAFTAASTLGFSTGSDDTGLGISITDSDFTAIEATFTQTTDYLQADINDTDFFGTEGGLEGRIDTYLGKTNQTASSYLTTQFGSQAPAYRRLCYAVAYRSGSPSGMYLGNSNYPKPPSWVLRRVVAGNALALTDGAEDIGGDANPANILYECLTDQIWGLGIPAGQIDDATFDAAAYTLKAEAFGLSEYIESPEQAEDLIDRVLRQIDAVLGTDPVTGLIVLKLVRGDYDIDTVPVINIDNASVKLTRGSWDDTVNVVKVRYIDRLANYTERVVQAMDQANIQARNGEQVVQELSFPGISNARNAQIAADRSIRVLSALLAQMEITMNRENWNLRPGSVFRLDWPGEGIVGMPCRATRVRHGEIDSNDIIVDAIQDVTGEAWPESASLLTGWGVVYGYDYGGMV